MVAAEKLQGAVLRQTESAEVKGGPSYEGLGVGVGGRGKVGDSTN